MLTKVCICDEKQVLRTFQTTENPSAVIGVAQEKSFTIAIPGKLVVVQKITDDDQLTIQAHKNETCSH